MSLLKRLLSIMFMLALLSVFMFILSSFMPGDALTGTINPNTNAVQLEEMRLARGFYDPWYIKYFRWAEGALKGDFGQSYLYQLPVADLCMSKMGNTFFLGFLTTIICFGVAIPLGLLSGYNYGRLPDRIITTLSYMIIAVPLVAIATISILLFSVKLKWFPMGGSEFSADLLTRLHHSLLPAAVSALVFIPVIIQILRSEVVVAENSTFVRNLRAAGLPENKIYNRHVLPNAIIPVSAISGNIMAAILCGSVFVENIFSYPGAGSLFVEVIMRRDYSVVNFLVMLFAAFAGLGALFSDILLLIIDPRVRNAGRL